MSEVLEKKVCKACGADIRPQSLFCYNCGSAVSETDEIISETVVVDEGESLTHENKDDENPEEIAVPTEKKAESAKKTNIHRDARLKSAASMRRKSRILQPKKVEVVWEEHENAPNGWFLAVALLLTIISGVILFLVKYFK